MGFLRTGRIFDAFSAYRFHNNFHYYFWVSRVKFQPIFRRVESYMWSNCFDKIRNFRQNYRNLTSFSYHAKAQYKRRLSTGSLSLGVIHRTWRYLCVRSLWRADDLPIIRSPFLALVKATQIWCSSAMDPKFFRIQAMDGLESISWIVIVRTVEKIV